uniref:Uncharacterized protein n=1 Tax=Amblyomma cajennense TaxID=34607 RepID=A0A023FBQ2_AMBCJ
MLIYPKRVHTVCITSWLMFNISVSVGYAVRVQDAWSFFILALSSMFKIHSTLNHNSSFYKFMCYISDITFFVISGFAFFCSTCY